MNYHYLVIWRPFKSDKAEDMKVAKAFSIDDKNIVSVRNHVEANWEQEILDICGPGRISVVKTDPNKLFWIE